MRKTGKALMLVYVVPFLLFWACGDKENMDPWVKITAPKDEALLLRGDVVPVKAMADDEDGTIANITIYIDGEEVGSSDQTTFIYWWNTAEYDPGDYDIRATTSDNDGAFDADRIDVVLGAEGGLNPDLVYDTLSDIDGNRYASIQIGEQVWMAENLRVTHYADGTPIMEVVDEAEWTAMIPQSQAYCWYGNQMDHMEPYGALYTWAAAMHGSDGIDTIGPQGVCPDGWHLPSDAEWKTMEMHLRMIQPEADSYDWRGTDQGGQLKEIGYSKWEIPNEGASNSSGFTAVPGGFRSAKGQFYSMDRYATFWTASAYADSPNQAWYRALNNEEQQVYRHHNNVLMGFAVRCVQDR